MISIKFLLAISMICKTEWSWELRTWSHKMNLLDILSTSRHYVCWKWIRATNENSNFDLRVQRVKVKFIFNICIFGNYWMRLSVIFKTMQTDEVLSAKTVGQKLMASERFPLLPPDYGTSSSLKFELVLMLIFLNLRWKRFFLKRYMTFSFIIYVFVFFPF